MSDELTELEYLWAFYQEADFGPAHGDVVQLMNEQIEAKTGRSVPQDYRLDEE